MISFMFRAWSEIKKVFCIKISSLLTTRILFTVDVVNVAKF